MLKSIKRLLRITFFSHISISLKCFSEKCLHIILSLIIIIKFGQNFKLFDIPLKYSLTDSILMIDFLKGISSQSTKINVWFATSYLGKKSTTDISLNILWLTHPSILNNNSQNLEIKIFQAEKNLRILEEMLQIKSIKFRIFY